MGSSVPMTCNRIWGDTEVPCPIFSPPGFGRDIKWLGTADQDVFSMWGCSRDLAGNLVFTVPAFPLFFGASRRGGRRRAWPLPLVLLSGDAKVISVGTHSTSGSCDTSFLEAQPLCTVPKSAAFTSAPSFQSHCGVGEGSVACPSTR